MVDFVPTFEDEDEDVSDQDETPSFPSYQKSEVQKVDQRHTHTCLFDFVARAEDELSASIGDTFSLISSDGGDWYKVQRLGDGATGMVPSNYLQPVQAPPLCPLPAPPLATVKTRVW